MYPYPLPKRLVRGGDVTVLLDKVEWVAQNGNALADAIRAKKWPIIGSRFRVVVHPAYRSG